VEANASVSMQHEQYAFDSRTEWRSASLIGMCNAFDGCCSREWQWIPVLVTVPGVVSCRKVTEC